MGKTVKRFLHFDDAEYWQEICQMDEDQLRLEHKQIKIKLTNSGATAVASGAAGFFTGGAAWILTAISKRRFEVNFQQCELIRKRLNEMEWSGHKLRKRDVALAVGPCLAAELIIPASSAVVGHAADALTQHTASVAGQHAAQAASQHVANVATQHVAHGVMANTPADALSNVAHHASGFVQGFEQGGQSELFTMTHGMLGHAAVQAFSPYYVDFGTAQAIILGQAAGQVAAFEAARALTSQAIKLTTRMSIKKAIQASEKNGKPVINNLDNDTAAELKELQGRAAEALLNNFYHGLEKYDRDGTVKADIGKINACTIACCDCKDYNDKLQSGASPDNMKCVCLCGHDWSDHGLDSDGSWLVEQFCRDGYVRFKHHDRHGTAKTDLNEIETCQSSGCPCKDYDCGAEAPTTPFPDCRCGHLWLVHHSPPSDAEKLIWIVSVASAVEVRDLVMSEYCGRAQVRAFPF